MGKRSTGRKLAMQAIYQCQVRSGSMQEVVDDFIAEADVPEETKQWAAQLSLGVWDKRLELDRLIEKYSEHWELFRITGVDLSVLRMALYELRYSDIAPSIAINEAIEIVKKYSTDDSSKFVNGILGNYVKEESNVHGDS